MLIVLISSAFFGMSSSSSAEKGNAPIIRYDLAEQPDGFEATAPRTMSITLPTPPATESAEEARTETMILVLASALMMGALIGAMAYIYFRNRADGFSPESLKADAMVVRLVGGALFVIAGLSMFMFVVADDASATTTYDFTDTTNNFAYQTDEGTDTPKNPGDGDYILYTTTQYTNVSANDGSRNIWSAHQLDWENLLYKFKINESPSNISEIEISWIGYDTLSNGDDFEINTWNSTSGSWEQWYTTTTSQYSDQTYTKRS